MNAPTPRLPLAPPDTQASGAACVPRGRPVERFTQDDDGRKKRRRLRNLDDADMLRPAEIYMKYGIPPSTLCEMCKRNDPTTRLPSILIPGRKGHKGLRLIERTELLAYLARFKIGSAAAPSADNSPPRKAA